MRIDSEIILRVLKGCLRAGYEALPVHDAMLTTRDYEGRVIEIMEEAAADFLNLAKPRVVKGSRENVLQMPFPPLSFPS